MSNDNNWGVPFSSIRFFENALKGHSKVEEIQRTQDILFEITLCDFTNTTALLLNEYTLGLASVLEAIREFPNLQHIVTGANWNGYTREAKKYGLDNKIGIFVIGEFLGALNWSEPYKYYKKDDKGKPVYEYRSA